MVNCVLLLLLVVGADVKHALNLEDVARSRVGAGLDDEGQEGAELGILDDGGGRNGRISQILLAKEEEAETKREKPNERILLQVLLFLLHQSLEDRLCGILITSADIDNSDCEGCD